MKSLELVRYLPTLPSLYEGESPSFGVIQDAFFGATLEEAYGYGFHYFHSGIVSEFSGTYSGEGSGGARWDDRYYSGVLGMRAADEFALDLLQFYEYASWGVQCDY